MAHASTLTPIPCQPQGMRLAAATTTAALLVASCSGSGSSSCADVVFEDLHPQSAVHVIADEGIEYLTDPPTSGPHASSQVPGPGVVLPLPPSVQVAVLESGGVVLQFQPDAVSEAQLRELDDTELVVFENTDLTDPIVVTAWRQKLVCSAFDADEIRGFRADHGGDGVPHG